MYMPGTLFALQGVLRTGTPQHGTKFLGFFSSESIIKNVVSAFCMSLVSKFPTHFLTTHDESIDTLLHT